MEKLQTLKTKLKDVTYLQSVAELLSWDQQVNMPPGASEARGEQLATLHRLAHEMFTTDEIGSLLTDLAAADFDYESDEAGLVRITQRDYDKARRLSPELVAEQSRLFSQGQQVWAKARADNEFSQFQPVLEQIVDLNIKIAEAYGYQDCLYDALLDIFEPGMKTAEVNQVFDVLKRELVPFVKTISESGNPVDDSPLKQAYAVKAQWELGLEILRDIGFDLQRGRLDKSVHPFSSSSSVNDVRLTTRLSDDTFPSSLFSTLHEAGHGMYEQNIAQSLEGSPLADGTSLGVHESQSRLWENLVGRSSEFWRCYYPRLQSFFPNQLGDTDMERFYRAINKVEPSLIRVEADEITYNLHIFLRFELEQELVEKRLAVADLPEAWNAKMSAYLGLTPPDDANGVLQDIHWSVSLMGYFPTYTLGNVLSLQLYQQALQDQPDLPTQFSRGQFETLLNWLRYHIHHHGRKFTMKELIHRVTGADGLQADPYLSYINRKFSQIYEL